MRLKFLLSFYFCLIITHSFSQEKPNNKFRIGDKAPNLYIKEWIKGEKINTYKKNHVYVVEFWATWCLPCINAMPHLSYLAKKYNEEITIIGINVYEKEETTLEEITKFVKDKGDTINYSIGIDENNRMVKGWLEKSEEARYGIPRTFVINGEGKVAWVGHPQDLEMQLKKILKNGFDLQRAAQIQKEGIYLDSLQNEVRIILSPYIRDPITREARNNPENVLRVIDSLIRVEPKLKDTRAIVFNKFSSLMQVDQKRARKYAKRTLKNKKQEGMLKTIIDVIHVSEEFNKNVTKESYLLGAKTYQKLINNIDTSNFRKLSTYYNKMAHWYWKAGKKRKSIKHQKKSIENLKRTNAYTTKELDSLILKLNLYNSKN